MANNQGRRSGFTLIELLITITIIGIMASMILFALYGAGEAAKSAKTRSRVTKLSNIIAARYEAYRTRRVPTQFFDEQYTDTNMNGVWDSGEPLTDANGNSVWDYSTRTRAKVRLDALRDLIRMELPDRWTDVVDPPMELKELRVGGVPIAVARPSLSQAYLRRYNQASAHPNINIHEAAECLYMIVMEGIGEDADSREVFKPGDSADTDGDGLREFVDGWGKPIYWVRWPVGFQSDLVQMPMGTVFDTFDSMHIYPINLPPSVRTPDLLTKGDVFSMQPLVYSAGPDGVYAITRDRPTPIHYTDATYKLNPYFDPSPDKIIGAPDSTVAPGAWNDNIHSHALMVR